MRPPPTREALLQLMQAHWGYTSFRPLQEDIINAVSGGYDALALLPTGGGKSLCYQLPAIAQLGCSLVISPLIALMEEQISTLTARGVTAVALHGGLAPGALQHAMQDIREGGYKIIYCSPERLQTRAFRDLLSYMPLSLIAVDEAHCVSQWGHDFRPEYMDIAWLRKLFVSTPMLALTATATPAVVAEIVKGLELKAPAIFRQSFARTNLFYEVRRSEGKPAEVLRAVRECGGSAIVYCRSRADAESISHSLKAAGIAATCYHAGLTSDARSIAQESWMRGEAPVIAATTAFGMGIDKGDVRLVLHYEPPGDLESWYQESGRAGRDGGTAAALTLYDDGDIRRLKASTKLQYPTPAFLRSVYQSVVEYLQVPVSAQPDRYFQFDIADFCRKFSLRTTAALPAVRLLAQEGLWTITDAVLSPPRACFTTSRERLDDFISRYPVPGMVATALLRLYAGIFRHRVSVHLSAVAAKLRWSRGEVEQAMRELSRMGIIDWAPPPEGPQLFFHHYRVASEHLVLNTERIEMLRSRHEARTAAMIAAITDETHCREQTALSYFGENVKKGDCGHCDVCRRKTLNIPGGRTLRTMICEALKAGVGRVRLADLSSLVPHKEAAAALIDELRILVSAGLVEWHPDNTFSIIPQTAKRRKNFFL